MLLAKIRQSQMQHLDEVIINEKHWSPNRFHLFNNEAASGKSYQVFKSIAKLAINTDCMTVYVQPFANENSEEKDEKQLKDTVEIINKYAGRCVAGYICSTNKRLHNSILKNRKVIVITHRMYLEMCKGVSGLNILNNADVLIIDEFINLFIKFRVTEIELNELCRAIGIDQSIKTDVLELVNFIKLKLNTCKKEKKKMKIVNLFRDDVKKHIKTLDSIIELAQEKDSTIYEKLISTAKQVKELFKHSCVYSSDTINRKNYPAFFSYYSDIDYVLANKNNIILDANGGFDQRYRLRNDMFKLDRQIKCFDYADSILNYYSISTTKTANKKYENILEDVVNYIQNQKPKGKSKHLIVTDKSTHEKMTEEVHSLIHTCEIFNNIEIDITHFGNIIGKNDWRDYQNVWIIKTPYYSWIDYILQYLFYSGKILNGNTSCEITKKAIKEVPEFESFPVFKNKEFDKIKNSIVLGEVYQAAKRIARGKDQPCTINLITADIEILKLLKKEFKNIEVKSKFDLNFRVKEEKQRKKKASPKTDQKIIELDKFIKKEKNKGKDKIAKAEIIDLLSIKKPKLSALLKKAKSNGLNIIIGKGKEQEYIYL